MYSTLGGRLHQCFKCTVLWADDYIKAFKYTVLWADDFIKVFKCTVLWADGKDTIDRIRPGMLVSWVITVKL